MNYKTILKLQDVNMVNTPVSIAKTDCFWFIFVTQHATTSYETHVLSRVIYWWHVIGIILQGKS